MARRSTATLLAAATGVVVLFANAAAADSPVTGARIIAHFDFAKGQTAEDVAIEPDGSADVTLAEANQVVHVFRDGRVALLAQLPAGGACPVVGKSATVGIARARDGAVYVVECSGDHNQGVWRLRRGQAPVQIASLPQDGFPNDMDIDGRTGNLYVTDSARGEVWKVPTNGGPASLWATGTALQKVSFLGANGLVVHDGAVWVGNTDTGDIVKIPIRADGTAGAFEPVETGLAGGLDNFTVIGDDDTIVGTLNIASELVVVRPGESAQVVLTAADGLSNPTDVKLLHDTLYVTSGAYTTMTDPNLLVAHFDH